MPYAVELQPHLDHVDGLQAACLHDAAEGPIRSRSSDHHSDGSSSRPVLIGGVVDRDGEGEDRILHSSRGSLPPSPPSSSFTKSAADFFRGDVSRIC
jgi:hypothetical protein